MHMCILVYIFQLYAENVHAFMFNCYVRVCIYIYIYVK